MPILSWRAPTLKKERLFVRTASSRYSSSGPECKVSHPSAFPAKGW
jgi:hypothetical protein